MSNKVKDARSSKPVRAEGILRIFEKLSLVVDRAIERYVGPNFNPLAQTGAIANVMFIIAVISGVLLLVWYRPSVHHAYSSLEAMSWSGQFMRSLHRYSSDACLFFVLVHGFRLFFARRFTGARWLAWVTGIALIFMLWFVGWLGYWLVWDERAQLVATGTARMLDLVPIFSEPLSRSFLTDDSISSLFFFVVFFAHMLIPLVMAVALWLHLSRVSRAKFLTNKPMTWWITASVVAISIVFPAKSSNSASMTLYPDGFTMDWWYLAPLILTERLGSGSLWVFIAVVGVGLTFIPWSMRRGEIAKAKVNTSACNGCTLCAQDCPYDAIIMIPREDGRKAEVQAVVNLDKCVGCGICVGACNPGAIGLDWLPSKVIRKNIDQWIDEMTQANQQPHIAFLCSESAAAEFVINSNGTCDRLPGYRVLAVPCAGWVQVMTIERALRRGAKTILIAACSASDPQFREGGQWTDNRLHAQREPALRHEKVDSTRVHFVHFNRARVPEFEAKAQQILNTNARNSASTARTSPTRRYIAGTVVACALSGIIVLGSDLPFSPPSVDGPQLVVSMKHHGEYTEACREASAQELEKMPRHMQQSIICSRERQAATLRIDIDGTTVLEQEYRPRGLSRDGPAVALEYMDLPEGQHHIIIQVSDVFISEQTIDASSGQRHVVIFDTHDGFSWH